jgi:hypothetical protein
LPLLFDALQAPFQKINFQRLLTDLPFELRDVVSFLVVSIMGTIPNCALFCDYPALKMHPTLHPRKDGKNPKMRA